MVRSADRTVARRMQSVRRRLESWRKSGGKGHRIPEPLWRAAAELARAEGVNPIARALGLDYYDLKRRVEVGRKTRAGGSPGSSASAKPANGTSPFVAFEIPAIPALPSCSIELEDGTGSRLSVRLSSLEDVDLVSLAQALWSRRP